MSSRPCLQRTKAGLGLVWGWSGAGVKIGGPVWGWGRVGWAGAGLGRAGAGLGWGGLGLGWAGVQW